MSSYVIHENTLRNIANAIRKKEGSEAPIPVEDYAKRIAQLPAGVISTTFYLSGSIGEQLFKHPYWVWFIDDMGQQVITENCRYFYKFLYEHKAIEHMNIDFNIVPDIATNSNGEEYSTNSLAMALAFMKCSNLKEINGRFYGTEDIARISATSMFEGCAKLAKIPYEFFNDIHNNSSRKLFLEDCSYLFANSGIFHHPDLRQVEFSTYTYVFRGCNRLMEISHLPVMTKLTDYNFYQLYYNGGARLEEFTFATNADGSPIEAQWSGVQLDFVNYDIGHYDDGTYPTNQYEIKDDATYQALKNDQRAWTTQVRYSFYNKKSVEQTIRSLPDASAYLYSLGAENIKVNNLRVYSYGGESTDGGAIRDLDTDIIALAASKGWTISMS